MSDRLSQTFSALADPTRRAMLSQLAKGEASVSDLARPFLKTMSLPEVTKHLKVLEDARLIERSVEGRVHMFRLRREPLREVGEWVARHQAFWTGAVDQLEALLEGGRT